MLKRLGVSRPALRSVPSPGAFAALGLGFIFFEITMIQRFSLFLGYPTYSLTVTLMALLLAASLRASNPGFAGKLYLAECGMAEVRDYAARTQLPGFTPNSITALTALPPATRLSSARNHCSS